MTIVRFLTIAVVARVVPSMGVTIIVVPFGGNTKPEGILISTFDFSYSECSVVKLT
jgi:hypothetical protein